MPLDPRLILQAQQVSDPAEALQKGLTLRDLMQQTRKASRQNATEEALARAIQENTVQDAGGMPQTNPSGVMSALFKANEPTAAIQWKNQYSKDQLEEGARKIAAHKQWLWSVTPESYPEYMKWAKENNIPGSDKMPQQYVKSWIDQRKLNNMTAEEQLAQHNKDREYYQKEREINAKKTEGKDLPIDQKKMVETLATSNANKVAIKSQIDAVLGNWDSLSPDQKLMQGRQLIKTLNSTEGKDAVGAEEANRLGSKLEFAFGNLTNSNPVQFGRDLDGFKLQAEITSKNIGTAIGTNQGLIDEKMGRSKVAKKEDAPAKTPQQLALEELARRKAAKQTAGK